MAAAGTGRSGGGGFSAAEKAAMREGAKEARASKDRETGLAALLEKVEQMPEEDRALCRRLHEIISDVAPGLVPRTWYGMPAYAKGGTVLCSVKPSSKFGQRYTSLEFQDVATLDKGSMWPVSYAITRLTAVVEREVAHLVRRAVG